MEKNLKYFLVGGFALIIAIYFILKKARKKEMRGIIKTPEKQSVIKKTGNAEYIANLLSEENLGETLKISDIMSIVHKESSFDETAQNGQYRGLFQMGKLACKDVGVDYENIKNSVDLQIKAGVLWLKKCLQYAGGDLKNAIKIHRVGVGCVNSGYDPSVCTIDNAKEIAENYYADFLSKKQLYIKYDV